MKKTLVALSSLAFGLAVIVSGCSKDGDTTAPVITVGGDNPYDLSLNETYVDPGVTAKDDEDGTLTNITINASGVNKDKAGSYTVNYSVSDAAGNTGTASRTVVVSNDLTSSAWVGQYSCIITSPGLANYNYNDGAALSTTLNNGFEWNKFGDYSNANAKLAFTVNGSGNVTVPTQSITCGTPAVLRQFSGSGTTTGTGTAGSTIVLQINETVNSISTPFNYTFTKM